MNEARRSGGPEVEGRPEGEEGHQPIDAPGQEGEEPRQQ